MVVNEWSSGGCVADALDHGLAGKAAAGDRASFAVLVEQCYDRIHRMAWRFTGSQQDAEDIAQDVCLKLGAAIKNWRGDSSFETWLYRLTYTTAIDHIRAHKRFALAEADNVIALFDGQTFPSPDAGADNDDLWTAVWALPNQQRDAVLLVYAEERSHAEAAVILGCSEKTVSWHLHEARKRLKIKLEAPAPNASPKPATACRLGQAPLRDPTATGAVAEGVGSRKSLTQPTGPEPINTLQLPSEGRAIT
jgi:RNA polymerase sigma-70 factor, ECF subfamily